MGPPAARNDLTGLQKAGCLVYIVLCGFPVLERNGFGFRLPISPAVVLVCSVVGGAVGGMMICSRPIAAGLIGGLLAGVCSAVAVDAYVKNRQNLWTVELVIVLMIASGPGFSVGWLLKWALAGPPPETEPESEAEQLAPPPPLDRSPHPISATCPQCRSTRYIKVAPTWQESIVPDRVCVACGTRYSPPAPGFLRALVKVLGIGWIGFASAGLYFGLLTKDVPSMAVCGLFLSIVTVMIAMLLLIIHRGQRTGLHATKGSEQWWIE